ncbi:CLUMA_CG013688, isoform A [Clunio marinus]|uniref:CLUMA_CG013688, isoform A n=1 Tax=Clunio marinus TaxID=568069 RepID=A0A1J1IMV5_9DIPT|nr:CLUMA_CG013688, isoform A [Clunio marinus]
MRESSKSRQQSLISTIVLERSIVNFIHISSSRITKFAIESANRVCKHIKCLLLLLKMSHVMNRNLERIQNQEA